jgi:hypothetical protein
MTAAHATEKPRALHRCPVHDLFYKAFPDAFRLAAPGNSGHDAFMIRLLPSAGLLLLFLAAPIVAEPTKFASAEHRISCVIPSGWTETPGPNRETVLKIAKNGEEKNIARITVMIYPLPAGSYPKGFDVWTMSDEAIRSSGESGSVEGEAVKVLKFGRGQIDRHHMIWTLSQRTLKEGTTMWQLAYEGVRDSEGITVQLTVTGEDAWFTENEASFGSFIKVLKLSPPAAGR